MSRSEVKKPGLHSEKNSSSAKDLLNPHNRIIRQTGPTDLTRQDYPQWYEVIPELQGIPNADWDSTFPTAQTVLHKTAPLTNEQVVTVGFDNATSVEDHLKNQHRYVYPSKTIAIVDNEGNLSTSLSHNVANLEPQLELGIPISKRHGTEAYLDRSIYTSLALKLAIHHGENNEAPNKIFPRANAHGIILVQA